MKLRDLIKPGKRSRTAWIALAVVYIANQFFGSDVDTAEVEPFIDQAREMLPEIVAWFTGLFALLKLERTESAAQSERERLGG